MVNYGSIRESYTFNQKMQDLAADLPQQSAQDEDRTWQAPRNLQAVRPAAPSGFARVLKSIRDTFLKA